MTSFQDISNNNLTNSELKLLAKCRLNALDLLKDILVLLSKLESRDSIVKSKLKLK